MSGFFGTYSGQLLINFAITGIVVVGFYITFMSGQLSVAHQMFMGVAAYVAGYTSVHYAWGLWQTIPVSMLAAAAVGVITGLLTLRLMGMFLAIATLALAESAVVLLNNMKVVGGIQGLAGIKLLSSGQLIVGAFLAAVLVAVAIDRSSLGLWLRAAADDEVAAEAAGVRVRTARVVAFGLGAAVAGLGGALYAHRYGFVEPSTFDLALAIQIVLAAKLGGNGFIGGPILGTAVVVWLPELLRSTPVGRDIAFGALLILIVTLRPDGLVGKRGQLRALVRRVVS
jgi:branched-chain amino acid transport system permease protein